LIDGQQLMESHTTALQGILLPMILNTIALDFATSNGKHSGNCQNVFYFPGGVWYSAQSTEYYS